MKYAKAERIMMRNHPEMSEKWIQHLIAEDPSILGLGDLVLRAQERIHAKAGPRPSTARPRYQSPL